VSVSESNKSENRLNEFLGFDVRPYEWGFLALVVTAIMYSDHRGFWWPQWLYAAALFSALPVLILRSPDEWRQLPNRGLFFGLLGLWLAIFHFWGSPSFGYNDSGSLFAWMSDIYTSPLNDEQHGLLIPFVVLALYGWKRKQLVAGPLEAWTPALGLVALGLLLHLAGYLVQQQRISVIAFLIGLYGITGLVWGRHWLRTSFFPFFLLIFSMPVGELAISITLPLRILVARIVEFIGHLGLAPDIVREGTQLMDAQHTFAYEVAPACSGIRSIVALLALTTVFGFVCFKTPWRRFFMIGTAIPLAILGNVCRLTLTVIVAEMFGQDAGKACETNFGYVTFAVAIVCVLFISGWLEKGEKSAAKAAERNPAPDVTPTP